MYAEDEKTDGSRPTIISDTNIVQAQPKKPRKKPTGSPAYHHFLRTGAWPRKPTPSWLQRLVTRSFEATGAQLTASSKYWRCATSFAVPKTWCDTAATWSFPAPGLGMLLQLSSCFGGLLWQSWTRTLTHVDPGVRYTRLADYVALLLRSCSVLGLQEAGQLLVMAVLLHVAKKQEISRSSFPAPGLGMLRQMSSCFGGLLWQNGRPPPSSNISATSNRRHPPSVQ